jgi:hypothetical protein
MFSKSSCMTLTAENMAEAMETVGARLQRFARGGREVAKWILLLHPAEAEQWFLMPENAGPGSSST